MPNYNMAGPALDSSFVTGAKGGIGDAVATIQTSLNNAFLIEVVIMFIGLAAVVGLILYVIDARRGDGGAYFGKTAMRRAYNMRGAYLTRHGGGTYAQRREYEEFGKTEGFR